MKKIILGVRLFILGNYSNFLRLVEDYILLFLEIKSYLNRKC